VDKEFLPFNSFNSAFALGRCSNLHTWFGLAFDICIANIAKVNIAQFANTSFAFRFAPHGHGHKGNAVG
jgi:hypothetical protein